MLTTLKQFFTIFKAILFHLVIGYSTMVGENSFIHSLVFDTTEGLIYTCNENHSFFFFQTKLSTQCCKPGEKVLCTKTKGWPVVIVAVIISDVFT